MNKSLLIVVGVVVAAIAGYIVYASYFTGKAAVGTGAGIPGNGLKNQPIVMPETEEQKLDALNDLASSTNASAGTVSDSEKEKVLNSVAGSPENSTTPAGDAEKIKLLESLRK